MSAETALDTSSSPTQPPAPLERQPTPAVLASSACDVRLEQALAASARTEANLSSLSRAIQHLGSGLGGAREANESIAVELEGLRELLGGASSQQSSFQRKLGELELALDRARKDHQRERTFLIAEHDAFLVKLLDEQEAELKRRDADLEVLRGRLAELEQRRTKAPASAPAPSSDKEAPLKLLEPMLGGAPAASVELERAERAELERTAQKLAEDRERARETVARLQAQRDEAQSAVMRISKERDEALQEIHRLKSELGGPRLPLSSRPPSDSRRDSSPFGAQASALAQVEIESRLGRPTVPSPKRSASSSQSTPAAYDSTNEPISSVLRPPSSNPNAAPLASRLSPAPQRSPVPEELRRALISQPAIQSSASSRPALKVKPDAGTRPLIGYAIGTENVELELVENLRAKGKPDSGR